MTEPLSIDSDLSSRPRLRAIAPLAGFGRLCRKLIADRRGIAAVEFAFVAPLLLTMYFVTMEVSQGIEVNKKIGRIGSMVADLVTQQQAITKTELEAIMKIGGSTIQPYSRTQPKIVVTAIEVTTESTPQVRVVWSRKLENGSYARDAAAGTKTTVPSALAVKGSFLVRVETSLAYKPLITWAAGQKETLGLAAAFDGISMQEDYYLRPRMSLTITCTDC